MVYMTVYPAFFRSAALIIKRFWMRVRSIWQFLVTELLRVRATFFDHQRDGLAPAFGSTSGIQRARLRRIILQPGASFVVQHQLGYQDRKSKTDRDFARSIDHVQYV